MIRKFYSEIYHLIRKHHCLLLALSWCTGMVSGILLFLYDSASLTSWMRSSIGCSVSIVGLLHTAMLPFLFSAFAVRLYGAASVLLICLMKACFFSFVLFGIYVSSGCAGWLVSFLLMLTDMAAVVLLYAFWLRVLSGRCKSLLGDTILFCIFIAVFSGIDYGIISPFLVSLIEI